MPTWSDGTRRSSRKQRWTSQQFRPDFFGVETNQFQALLADDMLRRAHERCIYLPLFTFENMVPKVVRIRRLTPLLSQGRLRFKTGSKGAKLLVEQLRDFPCGDFDDAPDALEVAFRLARRSWLSALRKNSWRGRGPCRLNTAAGEASLFLAT
jgi:predicted phage terminase large subunit-like protein